MSEHVQFPGAMILFVGVLAGSYCFALTSLGARERASAWVGTRGRLRVRFRDGEK